MKRKRAATGRKCLRFRAAQLRAQHSRNCCRISTKQSKAACLFYKETSSMKPNSLRLALFLIIYGLLGGSLIGFSQQASQSCQLKVRMDSETAYMKIEGIKFEGLHAIKDNYVLNTFREQHINLSKGAAYDPVTV